jgi:hypothetical protein
MSWKSYGWYEFLNTRKVSWCEALIKKVRLTLSIEWSGKVDAKYWIKGKVGVKYRVTVKENDMVNVNFKKKVDVKYWMKR